MPYYCTVPRCTSMAGKAKNVSFHQFPRDEELARLWNDILKRGKPYTKYSKVCSLHFKPEDYTITSVGKNKGQWRTLRKDAVPSQNLPSETPAPYSRKQWDSWSHTTTNVMDPSIHHQMAQAIYMQTMLAMQAAGATEPPSHQNGSIPENIPHTSNQEKETDITSYKCTECTKCFKDPDVFILHKRTHSKKNGVEKENFNMNLTLRSNPILANLLKTNNDINFDPNLATMESILMTALAANMDYLRNFSMIKEERDDRGELNHDRVDMNHDKVEMNHHKVEMNHDKVEMNHDKVDLNSDRGKLNRDRCEMNHYRDEMNHDRTENLSRHSFADGLNHIQSERRQIDNVEGFNSQNALKKSPNNLNSPQDLVQDDLNDPVVKDALNMKSDLNIKGDSNSNDENQKEQIGLSYAMNFSTKIDRKQDVFKTSYYNRFFEAKNSDCEDLNESVDSDLVIDESV